MHIRIIDAIQEQYGEKYPTLEDALNWWAWPDIAGAAHGTAIL